MSIPQTVICRACGAAFTWNGRSGRGRGRKPDYCTDRDCRRRRANERAYRHFLTHKAKGGTPRARRRSTPPVQPALPYVPPVVSALPGEREPYTPESAAHVERLFAQARARRLAEERATGQRRYRVEDGWQQRAGRSCLDGEVRLSEVA